MGVLYRNRPVSNTGLAHGGVGIVYKKYFLSMRKIDIGNSDNFEVLGALGNIKGISKKVLVLACYVPPSYTMRRGK